MTVMVPVSEQAKADAEELVRDGHFNTVDEAIEAALHRLRHPWFDEPVRLEDLAPHVRAAVEEGLADIDAGRVHDADEVFEELIADLKAMASRR